MNLYPVISLGQWFDITIDLYRILFTCLLLGHKYFSCISLLIYLFHLCIQLFNKYLSNNQSLHNIMIANVRGLRSKMIECTRVNAGSTNSCREETLVVQYLSESMRRTCLVMRNIGSHKLIKGHLIPENTRMANLHENGAYKYRRNKETLVFLAIL